MSSRQISTNVLIIWIIFLTCILSNVSIQTTSGQNGVIKVGLDKNFAPFEWGHDGEVKGFDVDLMNYMAEDLNRSVEYYPLIWDEVLESVNNGTIDVLFADIILYLISFKCSFITLEFGDPDLCLNECE